MTYSTDGACNPPSRNPFLALPRHQPAARRGNSTWRGLASLAGRKREYIVAKQKVLRACIRERRQMPYAAPETAFDYRPAPAQDKGRLAAGEELATFRYPAADYRLVS